MPPPVSATPRRAERRCALRARAARAACRHGRIRGSPAAACNRAARSREGSRARRCRCPPRQRRTGLRRTRLRCAHVSALPEAGASPTEQPDGRSSSRTASCGRASAGWGESTRVLDARYSGAMSSHRVLNQAPPLQDYDPLARDQVLEQALRREGAAWAADEIGAFARATAAKEMLALGFQANENPPRLRTHDRFGNRIHEVDFHPAWHELMRFSVANGVHAGPWRDPREGAHVARAAKMLLVSQTEAGHGCPISMTYSALPPLQRQPDLLEEGAPRIVSLAYDGRMLPAAEKSSALIGMGMTEKQGGSDVRANTTRAEPLGSGAYALTGHKWFCSAPMSDAFLVLAQAPRGLSCFFLPRWTPDGERNRFHLQRLKDKLGNRSNASAEVELDRSWARLVGDEGRGVSTIVQMVNHTRLDCLIGAAAGMRQGPGQAGAHRPPSQAVGRFLLEQPLMRAVLADLAIESEAATILMMRLARAYDRREGGAGFPPPGAALPQCRGFKRPAAVVAGGPQWPRGARDLPGTTAPL